MFERQGDDEGGARARRAFRGDVAAVTIGDLAADRQAYAGPFVCAAPVQPLEKNEDAVEILFIETDAVVLDDDLAKRLGLAVAGGLCGRRFENLAAQAEPF